MALFDLQEPSALRIREAATRGTLSHALLLTGSGDLQAAAALAEDARKTWNDGWRRVATMADHAPMDEIDGLFAQLVIYADSGAIEEFSGYCRRISKLVLAVGEAHSFSWWNLL